MTLKNIFNIYLMVLTTLSCGSIEKETISYQIMHKPPFSISEASFQKWVGGVQGSGSGFDLKVTFEALPNNISLKEFYFKGMITEARLLNAPKKTYAGNFKNAERPDIIMDSDPIKEASNTPKKKFPFKLADNEAIVSYSANGKIFYTKIIDIFEKPILAYPQSNPNNKQ